MTQHQIDYLWAMYRGKTYFIIANPNDKTGTSAGLLEFFKARYTRAVFELLPTGPRIFDRSVLHQHTFVKDYLAGENVVFETITVQDQFRGHRTYPEAAPGDGAEFFWFFKPEP